MASNEQPKGEEKHENVGDHASRSRVPLSTGTLPKILSVQEIAPYGIVTETKHAVQAGYEVQKVVEKSMGAALNDSPYGYYNSNATDFVALGNHFENSTFDRQNTPFGAAIDPLDDIDKIVELFMDDLAASTDIVPEIHNVQPIAADDVQADTNIRIDMGAVAEEQTQANLEDLLNRYNNLSNVTSVAFGNAFENCITDRQSAHFVAESTTNAIVPLNNNDEAVEPKANGLVGLCLQDVVTLASASTFCKAVDRFSNAVPYENMDVTALQRTHQTSYDRDENVDESISATLHTRNFNNACEGLINNLQSSRSDSYFLEMPTDILSLRNEVMLDEHPITLDQISHEPVICPITDCKSMVGSTALLWHFIQSHYGGVYGLPLQVLNYGGVVDFSFHPFNMEMNKCMCLGLLAYRAHVEQPAPADLGFCNRSFVLTENFFHLQSHLPMMVMAARTSVVTDVNNVNGFEQSDPRYQLLNLWIVTPETIRPLLVKITIYNNEGTFVSDLRTVVRTIRQMQDPENIITWDSVLRMEYGELRRATNNFQSASLIVRIEVLSEI